MMPSNITFPPWIEDNRTYLEPIFFILIAFVSFFCLQYAVRWYLFGKCQFRTFNYFKFALKRRKRSKPVPPSQSLQVVPPNKKWRISNEFVSLIHSVISGLWALYALLMFPKLASEMNTFVDKNPLGLAYLSFGYLLHDLIDLLLNERSYRILELLFHHVIVLTALLTTIMTNMFLGVLVFGLLMEINSIFLHTRSLMNLYGQPKTSTAFKVVALLNVFSFILFRMCVSVYLLYWQLTNALSMPWYLTIITFLVIVSLTTTNSVLLYRVLAADGLLGGHRSRQSKSLVDSSLETGGDGAGELIVELNTTAQSPQPRVVDEAADDFGSMSDSNTDFEDYADEDEHNDIEASTIPPGSAHHKRHHRRQPKRSSNKKTYVQCERRGSVTTGTQTNGGVPSTKNGSGPTTSIVVMDEDAERPDEPIVLTAPTTDAVRTGH